MVRLGTAHASSWCEPQGVRDRKTSQVSRS